MQIQVDPVDGRYIRLVPLTLAHIDALCDVGLDPALWEKTTIRVQTAAEMFRYVAAALEARVAGRAFPYVIELKSSGVIVGSTRYHSIAAEHRRLEIGFTWVGVPWQRTVVNTEAKYLLLRKAFEQCACQRVEFKVDVENEQSCQALLRLGATREATLRNYMYSEHKGSRDVALFSIVLPDWPRIKSDLELKLYRTSGEPP